MKKTYVLDTNVLLSDPNSIQSFDDNDVIIPMAVLEELDNHKSRQDEIGQNARQINRTLDGMRKKGGNLYEGISLKQGGILRVELFDSSLVGTLPVELESSKVDNIIIAFMLGLKKKKNINPILVSRDINVRLKCDALRISCEDYLKMRVTSDPQKFYRGVEVIDVNKGLIDSLYKNNELNLPDDLMKDKVLYPNQVVILKSSTQSQTNGSAITRVHGSTRCLKPISKIEQVFGLKPKNKEQQFSLDLLMDQNIKLLTLLGPSGTGKTLLALASAIDQLKGFGSRQCYEKIIITRPVQPLGKDIGFLPGTLEEKMEPWIAPIRDNLNFLVNNKAPRNRKSSGGFQEPYLRMLQDRGLIEIEAITFIRGRSIPNAFIVIDEAQNLSMHELKTIITRVGDGTKIVLTGDIEQIDNTHVDAYTNGLTYAVERFKEYEIAGHVTLLKGERSELATLASKIL